MNDFEKGFISLFEKISPQYRRSEVFSDFITITALEMYLTTYQFQPNEALKDRYIHAKKRYSVDELNQLSQLLAFVVEALTQKKYDFLGTVFMSLNLGDGFKGQYFTPPDIAKFMAQITLGDCNELITRKGFITLSEPACGSGVMVIEAVNVIQKNNHNPQQQLWVECRDIDFIAAMMCYIQLTLLFIPGVVIVGNTLTNEINYTLYTLPHFMGNWEYKLNQKHNIIEAESEEKPQNSELITESEIDEDEVIFY